MTFLSSAKSDVLVELSAPKRDLEELLFYRRRASPRFYTAKTLSVTSLRQTRCRSNNGHRSARVLSAIGRE